ncbi:MAG: LysR family transcriptional regulator [Bacteroidetes bacterium]|nr:LysR family transcriptional regulator [Bacteroidota bacterium]
MNLQQLEYILAVEANGSFSKAAEACFISQPALSMMVQKLEEELGLKIFDRSKQPIIPTDGGRAILAQAQAVLHEVAKLHEVTRQQRETLSGDLHIGIIPTLAPYLLPLFLKPFLEKYPDVHLKIYEHTTSALVERLKKGQLDAGLLATPLPQANLKETPLFYEPFYVYAHDEYEKNYLLPEDLNPEELWLLEEGHCLRSQILNLCELRKQSNAQLEFEAGSIDTLIKMVDHQSGVTIVPELATFTLTREQRKRLRPFVDPVPVREVSLVTHRDAVKRRLIEALRQEVVANLPKKLLEMGQGVRMGIG